MGLTIFDRYRRPAAPGELPEPPQAPQTDEIQRPSARRRLLLVTLPVLVAMAAAVAVAGLAYSALGTITTIAGTGAAASTGDGGLATAAAVNSPRSVAVGPDGDVYIAEGGSNKIRRIDKPTGLISVFAGTGSSGSTGDGGPATAATFNGLQGIDVAPDGTVYAVETAGGRVRKIAPDGTISTLVGASGSGYTGDGGPAANARLLSPYGVAVAADGSVLIADYGNHAVRKVNTSGVISTVAGTGSSGYSGNGGQATSAQIRNPTAVEPTADGGFYIAEYHRVRYVNAAGVISHVTGTGSGGFSGDGGAATAAAINNPMGLAIGTTGTLYVSDSNNHRIRGIDTGGTISTTVGTGAASSTGDGGTASAATINSPRNIAVNSAGIYIAEGNGNRVRLVEGYGVTAPTVSAVSPVGPANDNAPEVTGAAPAGSSVKLYTNASCTLAVVGTGTAADFAGAGITATVANDSTTAIYATATDAFNNASACSATSVSYTEDSTPPPLPSITGGPSGATSDDTPSWTFTTSGGTIQCRLLEGATEIAAWAACATPYSPNLSARTDGPFTFEVRAIDAAQNANTVSRAITLDRSAPAPPVLTADPGTTTNDITPTWAWTAEASAAITCRIDKGAAEIADWAACASPTTYDLSGKGDGDYTFSVRATDAAANPGAIRTFTMTLDTAAPAAPSITGTPPADGSDTTPTWTFGDVSGATVECQISRGATVVDPWTGCAATKTYDLSGQDGTYTFAVRARDAAGNESASTSTYRLDTAPPAAPTIGTEPPAAGNATSPSWAFTGESSAVFECRLMKGAATVSGWATCTSARTYALASETDGVFTFSVRATDAAGNVGDETTRTYELDRVSPGAPSFSAEPAAAGASTAPSWSFPTASGTTVQCQLARGSTVLESWATCTSPRTPTLTTDGDYTLRLRARDAAGNLSTETVGSYKLDRAAPAAPSITGAPLPVAAGTSPSWQFTGEAGATFQCSLVTGTGPTVISDWDTCTSPRAYDLSGEGDALYTFAVRARDAAGNTGAETTGTYRLDREAPKLDAAPPAAGNSREPSWSFSATNPTSLQCRLVRGTDLVEDWAACTSPKAWDLAGEPEGTYTFSVRAVDAGGDTSAAVSGTYLLDTVAPGTPAFGEAPAGVGTGTAPRWSWAGDAGATFECRIERDGTPDGAWSACASPRTLDLSARSDGRYTLAVRGVDAVGNRGTAATGAYILDRVAPPAPTYVTAPAPSGATPSASWGFVSEPAAAYECQLERDGAVVEAFVPCASPRGYDLAPLPDGTYVIAVRVTDGAGNRSTSRSAPFVLDRAGPDGVKLLTTPGAIGNDRTPTWAFALEGAAAFECTLRFGIEDVIAPGTCAGPQTYELQADKDGRYVFRVRGFDAVGNAGAEVEDGYELDTAEPKAPEIAGEQERTGDDPSPAWKFTAEAGAIVECQLKRGDDVVARMDECASPKDYELDLDDRGEGPYTFGVRATDAAGNTGELATATYEYERAAVKRKADEPQADPISAASAPTAPEATAPPAAPAATPAATTTAAERSERREKAAEARARRRAAAAAERRAAARRAAQAAQTAPAPKAKPKKRKKPGKQAAEKLAEVGKVMAQAAGVAAEKTAFPVLLLGLCGLFLVAQDRVDRRDPKLALAPIFADPEMEFVPRSRLATDEEEQEPEP